MPSFDLQDEMDMPTPCPECSRIVEFNDMRQTDGKICYHAMVCDSCYDELESDEDEFDDEDFEEEEEEEDEFDGFDHLPF